MKVWFCCVVMVGAALSGAPAGAASPVVPGAPTIRSVTAGLRSLTVAFASPVHDGGARISSYRVRCGSGNGGVAGSRQAYVSPIGVAGLAAGKTYTCTVAAGNNVGFGPASAPSAPATPLVRLPTVPGAPTITSVTAGSRNLTVAFRKPASDGGAPITKYRATCSVIYGGISRSHQAPKSPIGIACLEAAETYTCTVAAGNKVGMGHASAQSNPVVSLPAVPGAPAIRSVTAGLRSLAVAFARPVHDGGARIASYRVRCTSSNGGVAGSRQAYTSPIGVTGLAAGKTYTCTVAATNNVGIGPNSAPSRAAVPLSP